MIKQIIKRIFECFFSSSVFIIVITIINMIWNLNFNSYIVFGFFIGYFVCLLIRVPYNEEEIEMDEYIEKHNKNGF